MRSPTTTTTTTLRAAAAAAGRDTEAPMAFHGLLRRLPAGMDPRAVCAGAESARSKHSILRSLRVWIEPVVTVAADPASEARRVRELRSPASRSAPVRAVVLAYADGVSDVVVVADRALINRAGLAALATLLIEPDRPAALPGSGPLDRRPIERQVAPPPTWGLADPRQVARFGRVDLPALPALATPLPVLLAATAIATARYGGEDSASVGLATGDLPEPGVARLRVDDRATPARFLAAAATAAAAYDDAADVAVPATGIALTSRHPEDRYDPGPTPMFPLTLTWEQQEDATLHGVCHFDLGACHAAVASRFGRHVSRLVELLIETPPQTRLGDLELLDERDREAILALGRTPSPGGALALTIHESFGAVARTQPDAPAVSDGRRTLTYAQLDARGDAVATGLRERGVGPGARVGVCLDNGPELVATLLGVLRAQAAYVPIDPRYPAERMRYILEDAGVAAVVTALEDFPATAPVPVLDPSDLLDTAADAPLERRSASPEDPAYVIYTSGSTGRPKGVVVGHRNVTALLAATAPDMALGQRDVWTAFHSSAFDFSVWEIWGCLLTGGHLVTVPHCVSRSPEAFHDLLTQRNVTVLNQTPSAFGQLLDVDRRRGSASSVRLVVFGGEPLDVAMLDEWLVRHPRCRLVNMFGITETTVHVTAQTITARDVACGSRSVGRALPGWSVSVRDERGRPQPIGVPGEIYVGGAGVASHYLNLDELTADRFVTDPLSGERLYRSGDRGRLRPDGALDHLGRLDSQVKLRGHRIELGEIRSVLVEDPRVTAAAVHLSGAEHRDAAMLRLDAYVVMADGGSPAELRGRVGRLLPDYMVPSTITAVPALPLTANGKLDVARLPSPILPTGVGPAPRPDAGGALVPQLLSAWREVFGPHVAPGDDFFALGGNSLIAVRLAAVLRDAGLPRVALRDLYLHPTVSRLATALAASEDA